MSCTEQQGEHWQSPANGERNFCTSSNSQHCEFKVALSSVGSQRFPEEEVQKTRVSKSFCAFPSCYLDHITHSLIRPVSPVAVLFTNRLVLPLSSRPSVRSCGESSQVVVGRLLAV